MDWLDASEALALLGVQPQTLYANVSRGRIRARRSSDDPRKSLYAGEDVRALARRGAGRRKADVLAQETIRWGDPILSSSVSTVVDGRLYYRGQDAIALSAAALVEDVAALLWQSAAPVIASQPVTGAAALPGMYQALAQRAAEDPPTGGRSPEVLRREAAGVFSALANTVIAPGSLPLHQRLATAWQKPEVAEPLRVALVLLADHELNASTFAARVAASTGVPLAAAALAGLATLTGPLHGGAPAAAHALIQSADRSGPDAAIRAWMAQGRALPGIGHALYAKGDPRAQALLGSFKMPSPLSALLSAVEAISGERPNIDLALACLVEAFDLPADAAFTIFALGRSCGWLAHAIEQVESGHLIRPRARYTGPVVRPEGQ